MSARDGISIKFLTAHNIGMVIGLLVSKHVRSTPEVILDVKPPIKTEPELKSPNSLYRPGYTSMYLGKKKLLVAVSQILKMIPNRTHLAAGLLRVREKATL